MKRNNVKAYKVVSPVFENRLEFKNVYGISRMTLWQWEKDNVSIEKLAERGLALSPTYHKRLLAEVDVDRIESMPNDLSEREKEYLRLAYSVPGGLICLPKPTEEALKGYYYDEERERWYSRPYIELQG